MDERPVFEMSLTAEPEHIDELGHVNNAVWVQWIQEVAVAHWSSVADPAHQDDYIWVVVRHEIDYLRAALEGERLTGADLGRRGQGRPLRPPHGIHRRGRKVRVRARTCWAIIDKASGRPIRVPPRSGGAVP